MFRSIGTREGYTRPVWYVFCVQAKFDFTSTVLSYLIGASDRFDSDEVDCYRGFTLGGTWKFGIFTNLEKVQELGIYFFYI